MSKNNVKNEKEYVIHIVIGSSFGDLVIIENTENKINTCKLCKYNGKSNNKLPCSWCTDYIGRNGYYR